MQGRSFQTIISLAIYIDIKGPICFQGGRLIMDPRKR